MPNGPCCFSRMWTFADAARGAGMTVIAYTVNDKVVCVVSSGWELTASRQTTPALAVRVCAGMAHVYLSYGLTDPDFAGGPFWLRSQKLSHEFQRVMFEWVQIWTF